MKKILLTFALATSSLNTYADICGIVTRQQAEKSLSILTVGTKITQTYSTKSKMTVKTVSIENPYQMGGEIFYELKVNGEIIDPGHTNVIINNNVSLNLGRIVGCDQEVSDPDLIIPTSIKGFLK